MKLPQRSAWLVAAALFLTLFFVAGAAATGGVFFLPLLKQFGWSRERLSMLFGAAALSAGAAGPLVGWMLDRIDARKVMGAGAILIALGYFGLSRANSFPVFLALFIVMGVGGSAATVIPSSVVVANWFREQRGLAMGIVFCAAPMGGAALTIVANFSIAHVGWRLSEVMLAAPVAIAVVPFIFAAVRTRPPSARPTETGAAAAPSSASFEVPGLELAQAFKTRSFWLITTAWFLAGCTGGIAPHYIAYLVNIGYTAAVAAEVASASLVVITVGHLLAGIFGDRIGPRPAYATAFAINALSNLFLLAGAHGFALAMSVITGGIAIGALAVLSPLVIVETLGLKRLGSLIGIAGIAFTVGAALGPVATGRIFDATGSYASALWIFAAMLIVCSAAIFACRPLEQEQARFAAIPSAA